MFTTKKIAIVSVINDLVTDARVNKACLLLHECGYDVLLIGRELPNSLDLPKWPYRSFRLKMFFVSGPLFYLFFNIRLFWILLFKRADLLFSNDLDTLLPNYLIAKLKKTKLIFDSHELFCEVPELSQSPFKKKIWQKLEAWMLPNLEYCVTVNDSIAEIFKTKYGVNFVVVRNISLAAAETKIKNRKELSLPENKRIILLQGAGINIDRGAEELIQAMNLVEDAVLYIIGSGDSWPILKGLVKELSLEKKVILVNKIPKNELWQYTSNADLGISIDKNTNLNYCYSLPNKIFDYIQAGLPILASRLVEIEKIVSTYQIGDFIESHAPTEIAHKIDQMLNSPKLIQYKRNTEIAKQDLNWEKEKIKLQELILAAQSNSMYTIK